MKVTIVTTGGTIAKTYDETDGSLKNERPVIESLVATLRLPDLEIDYCHLLNKDSLDLSDEDRQLILNEVSGLLATREAIMVIHGTDTLEVTGELLHRAIPKPSIPIILTGAMRPFEFRDSDAGQNVTEALLACTLVEAGVYVVMHGKTLRFPGVVKDRESLTFVRRQEDEIRP